MRGSYSVGMNRVVSWTWGSCVVHSAGGVPSTSCYEIQHTQHVALLADLLQPDVDCRQTSSDGIVRQEGGLK